MSIVDDALNYEKYVATHGTYQLTRLIQQTSTTTVNLPTSGGTESIFEIPPKVFNAAKSFLSFTATCSAAAGPAAYNVMFADGYPFIRQIQLYTRTGIYLVDINDVDRYTNMTLRHESKLQDVLSWDKVSGLNNPVPNPPLVPSGIFNGLTPSNDIGAHDGNAAGARFNHTEINTKWLEPSYVISGSDGLVDPIVSVRVDFDKLKNCLLGLDKDLYFKGEILNLRIVWNASTKVYGISASALSMILWVLHLMQLILQT